MNRAVKRILAVGSADLIFSGVGAAGFYGAGCPIVEAAAYGFMLSWAALLAITIRSWADRDRVLEHLRKQILEQGFRR